MSSDVVLRRRRVTAGQPPGADPERDGQTVRRPRTGGSCPPCYCAETARGRQAVSSSGWARGSDRALLRMQPSRPEERCCSSDGRDDLPAVPQLGWMSYGERATLAHFPRPLATAAERRVSGRDRFLTRSVGRCLVPHGWVFYPVSGRCRGMIRCRLPLLYAAYRAGVDVFVSHHSG